MFMKRMICLEIAAFLFVAALGYANPRAHEGEPKEHEPKTEEIPTLKIPTRQKDSNKFIEGSLDPKYGDLRTYARRFPKPFRYKEDVDKDGKDAFIVAGVNSDVVLKNIQTISGVSLEDLEKRMYGTGKKETGSSTEGSFKDIPHWSGANNRVMRHSGPGFLVKPQKLRDLLREDNKWVLDRKLTHQKVAEPLLHAVEAVEKAQAAAKLSFRGKSYSITPTHMEGQYHLSSIGKKDPRDELRSGWIGYGTQGSSFNDDLFANWYFTLKNDNGKTLTVDALTANLIFRYGFYQGGPFRVAPKDIIDFFDLTAP